MHIATIATSLNVKSIPSFLDRFLNIIGPEPWIRRYRSLGQQMLVNPLLVPYFEDRHSLELRLGQLLDGSPSAIDLKTVGLSDPRDYALFSFIAPVVLVFDQLTPLGRNRVAGILRDGLNADLRPFKSEIDTVTHLMRQGFDVTLQDIDHGRGFDFLAVKDGVELEVECKSASGDLGRQVHRRRMIELSGHVQPVIKEALTSEGGRLVRVLLPGSLHGRREFLSHVAETMRSVIRTERSVDTDQCSVEFREFDLALSPFGTSDPAAVTMDAVQAFLERETGNSNHHVFFGYRPGKVAVAFVVESRKPDRVVRGLMHDLKTSARAQFTKRRPGVLVVQFLELSAAELLNVASHDSSERSRAPAIQIATNLFFDNPDRGHIHTLVYRAQGTLHKSVSVGQDRIERSYQEQGPTYGFKNPNHPLAGDPRYSLFTAGSSKDPRGPKGDGIAG
jgi:hypothetical protein